MKIQFNLIIALLSLAFVVVSCDEETTLGLTQEEKDEIIITDFLQDNNITAQRTESGLYYQILETSEGAQPSSNAIVEVAYEGRFIYGDIFTNSEFTGEPYVIQLSTGLSVDEFDADSGEPVFSSNNAFQGRTEAVRLLKIGEKARFYIPSGLAYGPAGLPRSNPAILPNQILIYDFEITSILR